MRSAWLVTLAGVGLLACGSSDVLFGAGGAQGGSGTTSTGDGGVTATTTGSDTGSTGTTTTGTTGTSSQGGSASGGGSPGGSGQGAAGAGSGQGGSSSPPTLPCGDQQCPLGGESACCWDEYWTQGPPQAACVSGSIWEDGCDTMQSYGQGLETRIECALPSHCPGQICCARRKFFQSNGQQYAVYDQLACEWQCDYPDIVVCDAGTNCPMLPGQMGQPPVKGVCKQSDLLPPGYTICGYP